VNICYSGCLRATTSHKAKKFKQTSVRKLMATVFWDKKGLVMVEFMQQGTTVMSEVYCETQKKMCRAIQKKVWNADMQCSTSSWQCASTYSCSHGALLEHFNWVFLTTLLTALISVWATANCLPSWRTGWDHSSTIMRCWWNVSKHDLAHRQQTSLTLRHTKTYSPIHQVPQFQQWLHWKVAYVCMYFFVYYFLIACFVNSSPEVTFRIAFIICSK
jgi:hypothetical protein